MSENCGGCYPVSPSVLYSEVEDSRVCGGCGYVTQPSK